MPEGELKFEKGIVFNKGIKAGSRKKDSKFSRRVSKPKNLLSRLNKKTHRNHQNVKRRCEESSALEDQISQKTTQQVQQGQSKYLASPERALNPRKSQRTQPEQSKGH